MTIELVDDLEGLGARLAASYSNDVWFFKHSLICGASSAALREFERFARRRGSAGSIRFCKIEIQPSREVSRALAQRLAVRHQSPQALLVRRGVAVWHASHWSITERSLAAAG